MKKMLLFLAIAVVAWFTVPACVDKGSVSPGEVAGTNRLGNEIRVEKLWEHNGCAGYKVWGSGPDYFVRCGNSVTSENQYRRNRHTVTDRVQTETL